MEQALTVITSKENVQRPFLINAMADIPNDAETADPSNIKVVCRPDGTRALHFPCANSIPQGDA